MVTRVYLHFLLVHFWRTTICCCCMEIQQLVESFRLALDIGDQRPAMDNIIAAVLEGSVTSVGKHFLSLFGPLLPRQSCI